MTFLTKRCAVKVVLRDNMELCFPNQTVPKDYDLLHVYELNVEITFTYGKLKQPEKFMLLEDGWYRLSDLINLCQDEKFVISLKKNKGEDVANKFITYVLSHKIQTDCSIQ